MGLFGSGIGILLILTGLPFLAAGLGFQNLLSDLEGIRPYETGIGAVLIIAGVIIGKFWVLKVNRKRTAAQ